MIEPNDALLDAIATRDAYQRNPDRAPWQAVHLAAAQSNRCALCGAPFDDRVVRPIADPVIPGEVGGPLHLADNFALLCSPCAQKRAHRDLLDLDGPVPAALLERRAALWLQYIPHHLTRLGRGRSQESYRVVLRDRASHARCPWVVDSTPEGVWIGHSLRSPDGPGRAAHVRLLAEHGAIRHLANDRARAFFLPSELALDGLWALIEAGGLIVSIDPHAAPSARDCPTWRHAWPVHLVSVIAHVRRCQEPGGTPYPSTPRAESDKPSARLHRTADRRAAVQRWRAEAEAARQRLTEARSKGAPALIVDALQKDWMRCVQRRTNALAGLDADRP
ncbi:hypothetical protein [Dyella psychrodurans]|uniref:HNH endonuclease n=1 Tax=Dyella psychrodurans TaxID=1927960 RepID=A0A370XCD0_9GAMM|nr:hypothetical protein [Dyella psychrodurans]RDS85930.1 hypothetical protein DWU99_01230 [Dyella psychrodurans]